jgi:hypothetical protein
VDNCGNAAANQIQIVNVEDDMDPNPVCQNITIYLDNTGSASITAAMINNGSNDNCTAVVTLAADITSFDCSDTGPNPVVLTVTDDCGNSSNCTATVTVIDDIDPTISCLGLDVFQQNDPGICGAMITYATPVGTDNCTSTTVQTSGLPSGSVFPVGTTTNTFVVTDASLNSATCSFNVLIFDSELPTITCPGNMTVNNTAGQLPGTKYSSDTGITQQWFLSGWYYCKFLPGNRCIRIYGCMFIHNNGCGCRVPCFCNGLSIQLLGL